LKTHTIITNIGCANTGAIRGRHKALRLNLIGKGDQQQHKNPCWQEIDFTKNLACGIDFFERKL
jgi:hypothetical protein